ncbi:uncharacterized protein C8Q71DRAFT_853000 [Rhodofomes roseus]|uniref:BTB domain-containing protein n=1 Tax=Rhodofomes roseus TaxID=34475 RepID=A0ABQ8KUF5_9APHY|nr:uncharacterized protein C8Q71DRAFT_853000 [Rhodofomes roseus]KAH9842441.1 hypothetical protein C8Q71DRAFT_853000 [Rhodofomes roseus]
MDYFDFDMDLPEEWLTDDSDDAEGKAVMEILVGTPAESPDEDDSSSHVTVSVSYAFHPYTSFDDLAPDLVFVSKDQVFFYVHCQKVLAASDNGFAMLLPSSFELSLGDQPAIVVVPEPADVLNILLHAIYGLSALEYRPSFEIVSTTLDALPRYGLAEKRFASAGTPLYDLVVACAPLHPIDTYALAATHDLADAATATSAHLLAFQLATLSDEISTRIGAVYLRKLFFLHLGRIEALKHLLLQPPNTHTETLECSATQQRSLTRAWALAIAHVMWDAEPNLSTHLLQAALLPLHKELTCPKCQLALRDRIARLTIDWASVKRTI